MIEKIFESQLSLIFQSLGFYVVSTRIAESSVDLICVSPDTGSASYSMLVEAKTTSHPYTLPKDDSRALIDYINDVRGNLTTGGPLSFALILGPSASKNLATRVRGLEISAGLPVRFASAQWLASLREGILGPLPHRVFRDELLASPSVVADEALEKIAGRVEKRQTSIENMVRSFLS
jgi:hypothetical protein